MSEAVKKAYEQAIPGTKIILSPAAASFGMFAHEFERGDCFRQAVQELVKIFLSRLLFFEFAFQ